jgi:3D (Asp-Asp-Asp) domain-containing protein
MNINTEEHKIKLEVVATDSANWRAIQASIYRLHSMGLIDYTYDYKIKYTIVHSKKENTIDVYLNNIEKLSS